MSPVEVLICHSDADGPFLREFETHLAALAQAGSIRVWHHGMVAPGEHRVERLYEHLDHADIVILLLSAQFLASESGQHITFLLATERYAPRVVTVLLKPCDASRFAPRQSLPRNRKPISTWRDRDRAWVQIIDEIRTIVASFRPAASEPHGGPVASTLASSLPDDWRMSSASASHAVEAFIAPREFDALEHAAVLRGYAWLHGIHGIGKTTLARQVVSHARFLHSHVCYFDCRTEAMAYSSPLEALLAAFGMSAPSDDKAGFRMLRRRLQTSPKKIFLVLDEIDAFERHFVLDMRMFFASAGGALLISAHAPEFFFDLDKGELRRGRSEPPLYSELELGPLGGAKCLEYFGSLGVSQRHIRKLTRLCGGNPTLMSHLARMYLETGRSNPLDPRNHHALRLFHRYFERLWYALDSSTRTKLLLTIIGIALQRGTSTFSRSERLRQLPSVVFRAKWFWGSSISSSYDDPRPARDIISPLFMMWVLREQVGTITLQTLSELSANKTPSVREHGWAGIPPDTWLEAAEAFKGQTDDQRLLDILIRAKRTEKWHLQN